MRRLLFTTGLFATAVALVAAPQDKPNFSGRWILISPEEGAGSEQVVQHEGNTLTTGHGASGGSHHGASYRLDGSENRNVIPSHGSEIVTVSTATWTDSRLSIVSATTYPDGRQTNQTQVWSLDDKEQLIIELTEERPGEEPDSRRLVFRKRGDSRFEPGRAATGTVVDGCHQHD